MLSPVPRVFRAVVFVLAFAPLAASVAHGQAPPADPSDPLAKPATPVNLPLKEIVQSGATFPALKDLDGLYPLPQDPERRTKWRSANLQHQLDKYLAPFEKGAGAKAPWAEPARQAIKAYCAANARTAAAREGVYYQEFLKAIRAVDKSCDDPLVAYFRHRHTTAVTNDDAKRLRDDGAALDALRAAKAYPMLVVHASHNYRNAVRGLRRSPMPTVTNADVKAADERYAADFAAALAAAKVADWTELFDLCMLEVELLMASDRSRLDAWEQVDARLKRQKAPGWLRDTFAGKVLVQAGWEARGSGPGAAVDGDSFATFRDRLKTAATHLEAAWKAEPSLDTPATTMLYIAKGLGFPRKEMETWFRRALEANPDNFAACEAKKDWLLPHWYGSKDHADVLGFCLQCAKTDNFYGKLPYIGEVVILRSMPLGDSKNMNELTRSDFYFLFVKMVADRHIARYPEDRWARSRYAYLACLWEKWGIAHEQFEVLGDSPWPGWFPHTGEYDFAKAMAKKKK